MVFHQDSASSHTSKQTLQFLKKEKVNFIDRDEWMPKSPDAAPLDFGIWGILKRRLQKRNVNSVKGLKKPLRTSGDNLFLTRICSNRGQKGVGLFTHVMDLILNTYFNKGTVAILILRH